MREAESNPNFAILLSIDVEDWFQVENFKPWIPFSSWFSHELRVERNTHRILDLLDSAQLAAPGAPAAGSGSPKATFFILGWIAERIPRLVREIQKRGHEVASHGCHHVLCPRLSRDELKKDLSDSRKLLEDIIGGPVYGYRAPSFSIDEEVLKVVEECGYLYDSSHNSFEMNRRYGQIDLSGREEKGIAIEASENFFEIPISNLTLKSPDSESSIQRSSTGGKKIVLPWGGGGYFRLIPFFLFKRGVRSILEKKSAYTFYLHPWEVDPEQPRMDEASAFFKFRHYLNLNTTLPKLARLIESFKEHEFISCRHYLEHFVLSQTAGENSDQPMNDFTN